MKAMAQRYNLKINYRPIDLTSVYMRTGGLKLQLRSKERQDYRLQELRRFREELGMPLNLYPKYVPATGHLPSYFVIAAEQLGHDIYELNHAIMIAMWVEDRNIEDEATLVAIATAVGLDGARILAKAKEPAAEATYIRYTNEAIERGVFGAPFYFFRNEPFWGQDRLETLDRTIARALA
jgi:2-hydroxychromene-2-carboxylate isomerase